MAKKSNITEFIEKAKLVHGDYYDYSLVDYKGENCKISIICPINGVVTQKPRHHLSGFKPKNKRKENELIFINRAKEKHGDKYDYSLVDYKTNKIKVKIICSEHGVFEQKPTNHINGNGCVKCNAAPIKVKKEKTLVNGRLIYIRENARLTKEDFIKKAKEIHGDKYDYSLVDYKGDKEKVIIICPIHNEFEQRASSHIGKQKYGCRKCSAEQRKTGLDNFLNKAFQVHGDKFDYSLVTEYKTSRQHVNVICKKHGAFKVTCDLHINRGQGCPKCKSLNLDGFIEKANKVHDNKYDYSKVIYTNNRTKVDIICPIHGMFNQRVSEHINKKSGCPECSNFSSKGEKEIKEYLNKNNIIFEAQKRFEDCKYINPLPFDFYLPEHNICIEFNGRQHYEYVYYFHRDDDGFKIQQLKDKIKIDYCDFYFIKLITIKYDEDIEKILNQSIF